MLNRKPHWWRHYFTENVALAPTERTITLWFDFPEQCFQDYSRIVPKLQLPWIEAEFNRHSEVFNKYGVNWTLKSKLKVDEYSSTERMPDEVLTAMIAQLRLRHIHEDEKRREVLLNTFRESRPLISKATR